MTGAEGFIGGHLIKRLLVDGHHVIGSYYRPIKNSQVLSLSSRRLKLEYLDIRRPHSIKVLIIKKKPDALIHLAGITTVEDGLHNPGIAYITNTMDTVYMLEACRAVSSLKAIVIASSDKGYGESAKKMGYSETQTVHGICPYSTSKACADLIAQSYKKIWRLPIVVVRCSNIYGPAVKALQELFLGQYGAYSWTNRQ